MYNLLRSKRQFYHFNCQLLRVSFGLTPKTLRALSKKDESAGLDVIKYLYTYYRQKVNGEWICLNPEQYERCDNPEDWKPFPVKPAWLRQRRCIEKTPEFARLFAAFQDTYNPSTDRFLSILVELGSLNDMAKIRSIAKKIAGSSLSYCKVERPGKSKELKHHLHMLILETPETELPEKVGKYIVQVREIGQGKYAHDPILANLNTFFLYLHKPYDARIFASGKNRKNLHRLLLEDFLSYDPDLKRQLTPVRRWGLNLPY